MMASLAFTVATLSIWAVFIRGGKVTIKAAATEHLFIELTYERHI